MKVLVTAASRHQATAEIAERITTRLRDEGVEVEALDPAAVATLAGYDAVVLGSGVYAGRWLEPARSFAARLRDELAERPVWLFSSGPVGDPPKPEAPPAEAVELAATLDAIDHAVFAGALDKGGLNLGERLVVRAVRAPEGDYRDWVAIEQWAVQIARHVCDPSDRSQPV